MVFYYCDCTLALAVMACVEEKRVDGYDPLHYEGTNEFDLEKILNEVDNGKYIFTVRTLCPGMAKLIIKHKTKLFNHLMGKYNFASLQTICRAEGQAPENSCGSLCVQIVFQTKRTNREFITTAFKELGFCGTKKTSPLICSRNAEDDCRHGCFKVVERPRNCLFDKGRNCHYLHTDNNNNFIYYDNL